MDIGSRVKVTTGELGVLKYLGSVHIREGIWAGIELDEQFNGKNSGCVQGVQYFSCSRENSGIFVKAEQVRVIDCFSEVKRLQNQIADQQFIARELLDVENRLDDLATENDRLRRENSKLRKMLRDQ